MINYNVSINNELAQVVERQMSFGKYANRSEFFRDMIRRLFVDTKEKEELEIEPIMPDTKEYIEMKEAVKDKSNFIPYEQVKKELGLN